MKRQDIEARVMRGATLITKEGLTLRQVAKLLGVSKTTVHLDVTRRLPQLNRRKASAVRKVLNQHIAERSVRGGQSTKLKWEQLRAKGGW